MFNCLLLRLIFSIWLTQFSSNKWFDQTNWSHQVPLILYDIIMLTEDLFPLLGLIKSINLSANYFVRKYIIYIYIYVDRNMWFKYSNAKSFVRQERIKPPNLLVLTNMIRWKSIILTLTINMITALIPLVRSTMNNICRTLTLGSYHVRLLGTQCNKLNTCFHY